MKKFINIFFQKHRRIRLAKLKSQRNKFYSNYLYESKEYQYCKQVIHKCKAMLKDFDIILLSWTFDALDFYEQEVQIHKNLSEQYYEQFKNLNNQITDLESKINSLR